MRWNTLRSMSSFCHLMRIHTNRLFRLVALAIFLGFWSVFQIWPGCVAQATDLPFLGHRTGRESCWVEFETGDQEALCLPHRLWIQSYSPQGGWEGKWQASSPFELNSSVKKEIHYLFRADR